MPIPRSKTEVRRLLGMINYLGKFLPQLSDVSEPLRNLTKEQNQFIWSKVHQDAFNKLTQLISEPPLLRYYDLEEKVTIETDASDYGLGAVLLQAGRPVAFASRTMTETERRYSQIEKEYLALLFDCTRFDHHLHGRENITAVTDHKPLEKNHTCQKYQQRAQEVTTHDAATAKVPPKYCAQKGDSNVHN